MQFRQWVRWNLFFLVSLCLVQSRAETVVGKSVESQDPLAEVVNQGVNHAFNIQSEKLNLLNTHDQQTINYSQILPTLGITAQQNYGSSGMEDPVSGAVTTSTANSVSVKASATWTLWNNYASIRQIQIGSKSIDQERINGKRVVQQYVLQLITAYMDYQLQLRSREIVLNRLSQSQLTNEESQILVKVGAKTKLDAMDTEIAVANDQLALSDLDNSIASSERNLKTLINSDQVKNLPRMDLLKQEPYFLKGSDSIINKVQSEWRDDLQKINPDLQVQQIALEISGLSLEQTKLSYFPTTQVVLSQTYDFSDYAQQSTPYGTRNAVPNTALALTLSWNFWDWGATPATVAMAERTNQVAAFQYHELRLQTQSNLENLFNQLNVLQKTIETARMVSDKAEKQLDYSREVYRLGRITLLSMQQSTNRVSDANLDLAGRLRDRAVAIATILYDTGRDLTPPGSDFSWIH